ncbi:hypothetical protein ACHHYP_00010, partial [Achlya hypogyna]
MPSDRFQKFLETRQLVLASASGSVVGVLGDPHLTLRAYKARNAAASVWKGMTKAAAEDSTARARTILQLRDEDLFLGIVEDALLEEPISIHKDAPIVDEIYTHATRGSQQVRFPEDTRVLQRVVANRAAFVDNIGAHQRRMEAAATLKSLVWVDRGN